MKIISYIVLLCALFSCSEQKNEVSEFEDIESFLSYHGEQKLKGISSFDKQEISDLVYNYTGRETEEIIEKLTKITNNTPTNDEISILYGLEMVNRSLMNIENDSSGIIYTNTKLLVDSVIYSYDPLYYGTGFGTMNSYKFVLLKDGIFRVYWRSLGVSVFQGIWHKNGDKYTLIQNENDEDKYPYCFLEGDTLYECNSKNRRIMRKVNTLTLTHPLP